MKYLGQIIASVIYTCIFTGIMYYLITVPLAFILTLPWWGILLFIFIGGGILEGIITMIGTFAMMPYVWIAKKNIIAATISILLVLINVGGNIYNLWRSLSGNGILAIIFGIVVTVMLLQLIYVAISAIIASYHDITE